jgi:hypothetical protein
LAVVGRGELGPLCRHVEHDVHVYPAQFHVSPQDGGLRAARVRGGPAWSSFSAWSHSALVSGEVEKEELLLFRMDWMKHPVDPRGKTLLDHLSSFVHLDWLCMHLPGMCVCMTALTIEPELLPDGEQVMGHCSAWWDCLNVHHLLGELTLGIRVHGGLAAAGW